MHFLKEKKKNPKNKHVGLPSRIINIINHSIFSPLAIKNEQTHYSCKTWQRGLRHDLHGSQ